MANITVKPGQNLVDIAIINLGSAQGLFALANLNGLGVTDDLVVGQVLLLPDVIDKRIKKVFDSNVEKNGYLATSQDVIMDGIDYWTIGGTFIVSGDGDQQTILEGVDYWQVEYSLAVA
jgi:hypothetical protein